MEAEQRPVADRLDDVPLPEEAKAVFGHSEAVDRFGASVESGRLHHAWLVSGPKGIGKATLAFQLAGRLLSIGGTSFADTVTDSVAGQMAQGAHPNLLHLARPWDEKAKRFMSRLSVDEIRRTQTFFSMTAGAGGWRIAIVDPADDMNANAANALLKILEEPPKQSIFFVLSHNPGSLLPTIRSRCQLLRLSPLSSDKVAKAVSLLRPDAPAKKIEKASALSGGSVRKCLMLLSGETTRHFEQFEMMMQAGSADWPAIYKIADTLVRKGQEGEYEQFIDLILGWIGNRARANAGADAAALAGWASVWEKANRSVASANAFNLDRKQLLLSLFAMLLEQKAA